MPYAPMFSFVGRIMHSLALQTPTHIISTNLDNGDFSDR